MAKNFVVGNDCIKCKKCIRICPVENIKMVGDNIIFDEHCECCLAYIHLCPKEAINYGEKTIGKKRYINPNINIEEMKEYC
jgi:MinD superfamily P-loop ATPase